MRVICLLMALLVFASNSHGAVFQKKFDRATGSSAINHALTLTERWRLHEVRLHLSSASTQETLTIYIDSGTGTAYDTVLYSVDMSTGYSDVVWRPDQPLYIEADDAVDVTWTNTDGRTYGLEIVYQ